MTIIISHIPKTAGSSVRSLVETHNPDANYVYKSELKLGNLDFNFISRFRERERSSVLMGHFSYGVHSLLNITPQYVTVLREPIARIKSLYQYLKNNPGPNNEYYDYLRCHSLFDFVDSRITEQTNNHICRMIAGIKPDAGNPINERWLLELAKHNINRHYVLIGLVEELDSFTKLLSNLLGWPTVDIPIINVRRIQL